MFPNVSTENTKIWPIVSVEMYFSSFLSYPGGLVSHMRDWKVWSVSKRCGKAMAMAHMLA